ncbi:MAG: hypothetical protein EU530_11595 [Promethearchaeota archaeon]|nr:MAG: hypothetical protein EU530_11595 [Candidatus Lokiarchaeota archaeon]
MQKNSLIAHEDISVLALRLYRKNEKYDKMIYELARLCKILQMNLDLKECQDDAWIDVNVFSTIEEMRSRLKHDSFKEPIEEEIKELAKELKINKPEKSKLHWFLAEKMLVVEKLTSLF